MIHLRTKNPEQWVTCLPATYLASEHFYKGHSLTPAHSEALEELLKKGHAVKLCFDFESDSEESDDEKKYKIS